MKKKLKAVVRGYVVDVVSIDLENKYITWFDGQYDRSIPPNKSYEIESFEYVEQIYLSDFVDENIKVSDES